MTPSPNKKTTYKRPTEKTEPKLEDIRIGKLYRVTSRWSARATTIHRSGKFAIVVERHSDIDYIFKCLIDDEYVWLTLGEFTWIGTRPCDCR